MVGRARRDKVAQSEHRQGDRESPFGAAARGTGEQRPRDRIGPGEGGHPEPGHALGGGQVLRDRGSSPAII